MRRLTFSSPKQKARILASIIIALIVALVSMDVAVFAAQRTQQDPYQSYSMDAQDDEDNEDEDNKTEEPEKEYVDRIYLKTNDIDKNGKSHYVGEDFESKYKVINIEDKGVQIQLNGYYKTDKKSTQYETADSSSPLGVINLKWNSSNNKAAKIDPNGMLTAIGDGETTITATVSDNSKYKGQAPFKSVKVKITGQTVEYVTNVEILDQNGKVVSSKTDRLIIINKRFTFYQFYVKVTWYNPSTGKTRIEDTSKKQSITSSVKWAVGGSGDAGTVSTSGRFKSGEFSANCYVQCTVTGGKGGKDMRDVANIQIDTGEYKHNPASSLTLKVVYQKYPDKVVQKHKYSISTLSKKLKTYTNSYTIIGGNRYGTNRARGYLFKDIVGLENVAIDDVQQFKFKTSDGYNNPITTKMLYGSGNRYYFPNWDTGSRAEADVVPPILATESNMIWGQSEVSKKIKLDKGTRFRLVFGTLKNGASNSSYQIYYINEITIVLKGAPPANKGKGSPKGGGGTSDNKDNGTGGRDKGTGSGPGDGTGGGSGAGNNKVNSSQGGGSAGKVGSPNNTKKDNSSGNFRVYEMIGKNKSNVASLDMDLPYLPAAIPIALGGVFAGGMTSLVGFLRRL